MMRRILYGANMLTALVLIPAAMWLLIARHGWLGALAVFPALTLMSACGHSLEHLTPTEPKEPTDDPEP